MFNDVFVVDSAPDPYDPLSPYEYMDESGISWVTGKAVLKARSGCVGSRSSCRDMHRVRRAFGNQTCTHGEIVHISTPASKLEGVYPLRHLLSEEDCRDQGLL